MSAKTTKSEKGTEEKGRQETGTEGPPGLRPDVRLHAIRQDA
jgi:hypothetical protein